jgi:hypothetical protein
MQPPRRASPFRLFRSWRAWVGGSLAPSAAPKTPLIPLPLHALLLPPNLAGEEEALSLSHLVGARRMSGLSWIPG